MKPLKVIVCGVLGALLSLESLAQAQNVFTNYIPVTSPVAIGRTNAPGTTADFLNFQSASFSQDGELVLGASLLGAGVGSRNDFGLWLANEASGLPSLLAREDSQAPGLPTGVRFAELGTPAMNNAREVVFAATLLGQGVNTENDSGIWLRTLGRNGFVLNNLVREGNPPDSTRPDILWRSFGEPVLNWAGQVAFSGSLRGPGIGQANDTGLWVTTLRSVVQVTQEDQQAFGTAAGVHWSGFGEPALNVQGHVAFTGTLRGQGVGGANDSGLWVITPDSFPLLDPSGVLTNRILVAREGDLAADGAGAKWNSFGEPVLNSSGQLALSATLTGAGVSEYSDSGVWFGAPHQLRLVARENNAAPGVNSGTRWAGFGEPVVNDSGQIAFRGVIRGSGVTTGVNDEGIWVGHANAPETLRLVARKNASAPGVTDSTRFETLGDPVIDEQGLVAFPAAVNGSFNKRGIWALDPNGQVQLMIREGTTFISSEGQFTIDAGSLQMLSRRRYDHNVFGPGRVVYTVKFIQGTELYALLVTSLWEFITPEPPPPPPIDEFLEIFFRPLEERVYTGGYRDPGERDPGESRVTDVQLSFRTTEGRTYAVDARSEFATGDWETLIERVVGTGDRITLTLPVERDQSRRFFRVREDIFTAP